MPATRRPPRRPLAAVDLDWLSDHLEQTLHQAETAITVTDRDGLIIARRPDEAAWIGKPIPPDQRAMREIQGSEVRVAEGLDGRLRIIAAATPDGPLAGGARRGRARPCRRLSRYAAPPRAAGWC